MLVINSARELWIGERANFPGVWQFPQGGVEEDLSLEENVVKELNEELGAEPEHFKILKKLTATHEYEFNNPPAYAKGRWRGQAQTFWLVEFLGNDADIQLDRFDPEFSDWKWCDHKDVLDVIEPLRRPGYQAPVAEFEEWLDQNSRS